MLPGGFAWRELPAVFLYGATAIVSRERTRGKHAPVGCRGGRSKGGNGDKRFALCIGHWVSGCSLRPARTASCVHGYFRIPAKSRLNVRADGWLTQNMAPARGADAVSPSLPPSLPLVIIVVSASCDLRKGGFCHVA